MRKIIFVASALAVAAPATAQTQAASATQEAAPLDAERLVLGNRIAAAVWPDGTYAAMMQQMMGGEDGIAAMMLEMKPADILGDEALKNEDSGEVPAEAKLTMRELMAKSDPHFEERMRITMKVMSEEMARAFEPLEPKMRSALGKAFARRFTTPQLRDVAGFFATPSGQTYARESVTMFMDKEMMKEMMSAMPQVMKSMPQMMERLEKATAHLPPPPKPEESDDEATS